ncbi:MAG: hypothetical protein U0T83_05290 [Bacteriovoracaceae bacterium]
MALNFFTYLLLLLFANNLFANFPELFGVSPSTNSKANQFSLNPSDSANNYYAPSLTAFSPKFTFGASSFYTKSNFEPINNVTIRNTVTKGESLTGGVDTHYKSTIINTFHASIPIPLTIKHLNQLNLGFIVAAPKDYLADANSGDPFLPEYVMYRSRYQRPYFQANLSYLILPYLAASAGVYSGFQVSADLNTRASMNGTAYGSSGQVHSIIKPSVAFNTSLAFKLNSFATFILYQQEMKNQIRSRAAGETADPRLPFDIIVSSMLYYDPAILRFGIGYTYSIVTLQGMVERQWWENYSTPVMRIVKQSGLLQSSDNYEKVQTQNIFVPKLALSIQPIEKLELSGGYAKRPSPLKRNFSGAGNSLDSDVTIYSAGASYQIALFDLNFEIGGSYQLQKLDSFKVTKTSGEENGATGSKLGSPGYNVGGDIKIYSIGLRMEI